jgi:hypothetical protein
VSHEDPDVDLETRLSGIDGVRRSRRTVVGFVPVGSQPAPAGHYMASITCELGERTDKVQPGAPTGDTAPDTPHPAERPCWWRPDGFPAPE